MRANSFVLWSMIVLSLGVHSVLYLWLQYQKQIPVASKRGVVSVNFVEPVVHQAADRAVKRKSDVVSTKPMRKPQPAPPQPNPPPPDPQAQANEAGVFIGTVARLVAQHRIYPQEAIDREQEGKVIVGLTLDREGILTAANVEEASPYQLLNDAALKTVHAVGHYPPVPDIVPAPIHLHIPLVYRIERN
jgi:TonB family protein